MSAAGHAEETVLDWDRFVRTYWDRGPVVFRGLGAPAYPPDAVLRAIARARPSPDDREPALRFVLDGRQLARPDPWLPAAADRDLDAYARRVLQRASAPCDYALIVNTLHRHGYAVWDAGRRFFHGLWQRVGIPGSGAITTLFHGNYERTPVGVHKDRFATFLFVLQGRKRMRFWPRRPWTEAVATRVDYAQYLDGSFAVDVAPGDVLYWPADYYHVGETAGAGHATSVNVGIPRHEHLLAYDLEGVLPHAPPAGRAEEGPSASMFAGPGDALPPAMTAALDAVRSALRADRLSSGALAWHLQLLTGGGFVPPPPLAQVPVPDDGDRLRLRDARFPVAWARDGEGGALCGAGGHVLRVGIEGAALAAWLRRLDATATVSAGEALAAWPDAARAEARRLLQWLLSTRALAVAP